MGDPAVIRRYSLTVRRDVPVPRLTIAMLSDIHAASPYMDKARIAGYVSQVNGLGADLIVLLGDYAGHVLGGRDLPPDAVAEGLSDLRAPLGVYSIFGNHDWRDDPASRPGARLATRWHRAFDAAGIPVLSNEALTLEADGVAFTLAGLESQRAFRRLMPYKITGAHDLPGTLAGADPARFTLMLAHEPDIFPDLPETCDLTLSGHTHGGQIAPFGRALVTPSRYGARYAYGHFQKGTRHMVVSGGLGESGLPIRFGRPREITVVEVA